MAESPQLGSSPELQLPAPPNAPKEPTVSVPLADAQPAGTIVAAPVAPIKGAIPPTVDAVVVAVKPWWQSSEILTSLGVILLAGADSAFNALLPLLGEGPIDQKAIKAALLRSFLAGCYAAFVAMKRKTSNSVVR